MIKNYLDLQERRAVIYKQWTSALNQFIKDKEPVFFQTFIGQSTKELREIRQNVSILELPVEILDIIQQIEKLEDDHLRKNVEFQRKKLQLIDSDNSDVIEIEEKIMDLIQEIINFDQIN